MHISHVASYLNSFLPYGAVAINSLVPDAHYCERKDKNMFDVRLEVDSKLNCGFLFFAPWALMG